MKAMILLIGALISLLIWSPAVPAQDLEKNNPLYQELADQGRLTTGEITIVYGVPCVEVRLEGGETIRSFVLSIPALKQRPILAQDRIALINEGEIKSFGTPHELKEGVRDYDSLHMKVVGTPDLEVIKKMEMVMSATMNTRNGHSELIVTAQNGYDMAHTLLNYMHTTKGVRVEHFEVKEPTLDDVFLQLTGRRIDD